MSNTNPWSTYENLHTLKKRRIEQSNTKAMVYVHSNLCVIYKMRNKWLKRKTKMWDVFPHNMGLDNNIESTLANLDLNEPMLEPITFDEGDPLERLSSTPTNANLELDTEEEEEDGGKTNDNGGDLES
jgi:hypothetical protein